ncbi:putative ABC transporter permease [Candidatus Soleaferrea massiliensis]|uniref:putative ABC transporter permease n=1 Tax=Candidatus Soleaferrea massiliensis TaxID=1470354 RepID=UPI00058DDBFF|nr:putative ABC transporter permease [Candidatus Soleaferrea massiliensis]
MDSVYLQFLYLMLYSVIGWVCETIYCSIGQRRFVNRGFLNGPLCPIYGVGALLVLNLFGPFSSNLPLLFLASMAVTSVIEYITSVLLEKLFHLTLWNYSGRLFNLHGRICLRNSLLFGLMSVILVHIIHPRFDRWLSKIPENALVWIAAALFLLLLADILYTVRSMLLLNGKIEQIHQLFEELKEKTAQSLQALQQPERGSALQARIEQINRSVGDLLTRHRHSHGRILKAFPNMKSLKHQEALDQIRREIKKRKNKIK